VVRPCEKKKNVQKSLEQKRPNNVGTLVLLQVINFSKIKSLPNVPKKMAFEPILEELQAGASPRIRTLFVLCTQFFFSLPAHFLFLISLSHILKTEVFPTLLPL